MIIYYLYYYLLRPAKRSIIEYQTSLRVFHRIIKSTVSDPRLVPSLRKLNKLIPPTFMRHLPKGRLRGGRASVGHPRAQQGSCRVQRRRRRRLPAPHCRSARRIIRSAVTFSDTAATAASARTKMQAQPTAADRATATSATTGAAATSTAATSGHANTVLKSSKKERLGQVPSV